MQIKEVMTGNPRYVSPDTSLEEAARQMLELDCGFLAISDRDGNKLEGVITDRDITVRAVAHGLSPKDTTVDQVKSDKVLYCYADDDLQSAADSMREQCVYRLIVLNNKQEKRLAGVISLGDILRHDQQKMAGDVAKKITEAA